MRIQGKFSEGKFNDSFQFRNTANAEVFSLRRVGITNNKLVISGLDGKYNYLGELYVNKKKNGVFVLLENEKEVLKITETTRLMQSATYKVDTDIADYDVDIINQKAKINIIKNGQPAVNASRDKEDNYEIIIDNAENPVLDLSILVGVMSLITM